MVVEDNGEKSDIQQALRNLMAIERDRLLGYPPAELHQDPKAALQEAVDALEANGEDIDNLIVPSDQETLGIE